MGAGKGGGYADVMSELAVTFRSTDDATARMEAVQMPTSIRVHLVPRLHALAQHHLSASGTALFITTLIRTHLPNLRATGEQLDAILPAIIDALVVPEDVPKIVGLYRLTVADAPLPCVRPLDNDWPPHESTHALPLPAAPSLTPLTLHQGRWPEYRPSAP